MKKFKCKFCGAPMVDTGCENFKCTKCGIKAYTFMGELKYEDLSYDYDFVYTKPYACSGCGGNYPDCSYSCEVLDK